MQVQCIQREDDFLSLQEEWEQLWSRSLHPSYFLSYEWFACCWRELRTANQLRVFVVSKKNRPLLIAPLMYSRRRHKKLPVRCLTFIEHPEAQMAGMIFASQAEGDQALLTLMHHLIDEKLLAWDVLSLDKIPADSATIGLLQKIPSAKIPYEIQASHEALAVPLQGSWDSYLGSQSTRFRKTLRNVANRVQRLGSVEIGRYHGKDSCEQAIKKLFSVSDASWKVSNGVAITSSTGRMRFFEDLLSAQATAGGLRIWIVQANGIPIASEIQIVDGDVVYAVRSDYDERYADSSPGTYLQMEILKSLFESDSREYHMGVGLNAYKTRWAEQKRHFLNFKLYKNTLYGRLLRSADQLQFPSFGELPAARLLGSLFSGKHS